MRAYIQCDFVECEPAGYYAVATGGMPRLFLLRCVAADFSCQCDRWEWLPLEAELHSASFAIILLKATSLVSFRHTFPTFSNDRHAAVNTGERVCLRPLSVESFACTGGLHHMLFSKRCPTRPLGYSKSFVVEMCLFLRFTFKEG